MSDNSEKAEQEAAAFQKIWMESMSKMLQTAFAVGSDSAPPEVLRQIRSGLFQALAESWDQFMRSPQFLEGMKQWMENAVTFRKMTNDFLAKVRSEMQAPSREDIDTIVLTLRHLEKRLLDRVEDLAAQVHDLNGRIPKAGPKSARPATAPAVPNKRNSKNRPRASGKAKK
ncbi:conserved hypothetical protein [Verrucomicrobia bacterium]|nr:conserved hypothetical protein [Verrucomicrobiota bacterium]